MIKMICKQDHEYNGRQLRAGEPFEAMSSLDAKVLTAIGKAERQADERVRDDQEQVRDESGNRQQRRYRRRDMTAQE